MKSGGQAVTNIGKGNWTDALRLEEGAARREMSGRRSYVCTVRLIVNRMTTTYNSWTRQNSSTCLGKS